MKFMKKMAKCMWQGYTTNEDILLEIKINTVVKKIQNYRITVYNIFSERTNYYT